MPLFASSMWASYGIGDLVKGQPHDQSKSRNGLFWKQNRDMDVKANVKR